MRGAAGIVGGQCHATCGSCHLSCEGVCGRGQFGWCMGNPLTPGLLCRYTVGKGVVYRCRQQQIPLRHHAHCPPPLNATQQILILGFIPTWPPSLSTSPLIRFISPPPLTLLTATSAAAPPPLTKAGVLQRVAAFLAAYEHAMPAPAPTMVGSDALSLPGGDFPYAVSSATLSAVAAVFVKNAANVGVADRALHPFGVFAGAPGTGKTRGLLELLTSLSQRCRLDAVEGAAERGALAALQAGRYRHTDLVVWTYNNGNEPCDADGTVSHLPGSIPLLCVLHARVRRFLKACTL